MQWFHHSLADNSFSLVMLVRGLPCNPSASPPLVGTLPATPLVANSIRAVSLQATMSRLDDMHDQLMRLQVTQRDTFAALFVAGIIATESVPADIRSQIIMTINSLTKNSHQRDDGEGQSVPISDVGTETRTPE